MSQEKVERNKHLKAHRKEINRKKKFESYLAGIVTTIVCIGMVFWIGFSVYTKSNNADSEANAKTGVNLSAITDYLTDISNETEE